MLTLLTVLFWLAVAAGLLALYGLLSGRLLQVEVEPDEVHYLAAADGWRLGLARYRPLSPLAGAPPVLLCSGLALDAQIFELGEAALARFLAGQGYDVWALDWRGRGRSERPRLFGARRFSWTFDDYVAFDVPAALDALRRETGQAGAFAVGFGTGGLALLASAAGPAAGRLAGVATLGTTAFFRRLPSHLPGWALRAMGWLRLEALTRLAAPLLGRFFPGPLASLQNRDAVEPALYRRTLVNAVRSPSRRETRQLEDWLRRDLFIGLEQERDYRQALGLVTAPVLLIAGVRDLLAPVEAVEQTAAALPAAERQLVQASRMHGMASNYGHLDLLIGGNAPRDIFPHLLRWLDLHAGVAVPAGRPEPPAGELGLPVVSLASMLPGAPAVSPPPVWPGAPAASPPVSPSAPAPAGVRPTPAADEEKEPLFVEEAAEADAEKDEQDWLDGDVPRVPRED